jgi:hypothetical protein
MARVHGHKLGQTVAREQDAQFDRLGLITLNGLRVLLISRFGAHETRHTHSSLRSLFKRARI